MFKYVSVVLRIFPNLISRNSIYHRSPVHVPVPKEFVSFPKFAQFCTTGKDSEDASFLSDEQISEISGNDPEREKKLRVLILETEVLRQEGRQCPDGRLIRVDQWEQLLDLPTRSSRMRYLTFLFKNEKKREKDLLRKAEARKLRDESDLEMDEGVTEGDLKEYGLSKNTMFLRVYDSTMNQMYNNRLIQAMRFGQPLVLDLSYCPDMNTRECVNTAKQLTLLFAENRAHDQPFDLHYCNADLETVLMKRLQINIGTLHEPWFPLNLHQDSYLNHFPKEKLVYLTPHCREELQEFNHDDVYIIGAMVDKTKSEPLSLAKAKRDGLRVAKLPLDRYLSWGSGGNKSLTLNQVCSILLDLRQTRDWNNALKHVPRRKVREEEFVSKPFQQRQFNQFARKSFTSRNLYNSTNKYDSDDDDDHSTKQINPFNINKWGSSKYVNATPQFNSSYQNKYKKQFNNSKTQEREKRYKYNISDVLKD